MIPWMDMSVAQEAMQVSGEMMELLDMLPPFVKSLEQAHLERLLETLMRDEYVHFLEVLI